MKQITQILKTGEISIQDVPKPLLEPGRVLVRNHYSLISSGTEGSSVRTARKSLLGKAKEKPQQVKQVLDVLQKQGPLQTYRAVMKKLDSYSPLGYSSAGEVVGVGEGVDGFTVGDYVACAGAGYANHAEIVSVPSNLCVKLSSDADLRNASYNTLGAIAMQGVRQADLRIGESCAVIGLGLIGQLTCQILNASGVNFIGFDLDEYVVELTRKSGLGLAFHREDPSIVDQVLAQTSGMGVDAVIITAGTDSLDPVNFAGEIARNKGRVVIVGAVPTGFDREPHYYRKELDLRMSCSYGPGRYDLAYEEKGFDYPPAYVRWTENRNMQAFQALLSSGRININYLTTHEYPLERSLEAYNLILERTEPFLGLVIKYDHELSTENKAIHVNQYKDAGNISIGFIGAGSYAQGHLLPHIPQNDPNVVCRGVVSATGTSSKRVAEKYNFEFCSDEPGALFDNDDINTVFIATRHDSHAQYVLRALKSEKHLFVEKPLCLTVQDLEKIKIAYASAASTDPPPHLMVGFNRRFSPLTDHLKKTFKSGPMTMLYRVNAGMVPPGSWIQDLDIGGGRIVGEVCHFIDFMTSVCRSVPVRVFASAMPDAYDHLDTVSINLEFADGSTGLISYLSNGSSKLPKEYFEVHQSGMSGVIEDFRKLSIYRDKKTEVKKLLVQDKGQARMVANFLDSINNGNQCSININEIFSVSEATIKILESIKTREPISL